MFIRKKYFIVLLSLCGNISASTCLPNLDIKNPENQSLYQGLVRGHSAAEACKEGGNKTNRYYYSQPLICKDEIQYYKIMLAKGLKFVRANNQFTTVVNMLTTDNLTPQICYQEYSQSAKELNIDEALDEIDRSMCFKDALSEGILPSNCPVPTVQAPELVCGGKSAIKGDKLLLKLEKAIRNKSSCQVKSDLIKAVFSSKVNNHDDLIILTYVANHLEELARAPGKRQLLGAVLEAGNPVALGVNEDISPNFTAIDTSTEYTGLNNTALELRMGLIGTERNAWKEAGLSPEADICNLTDKTKQNEVITSSHKGFELIMSDSNKRKTLSQDMRNQCDHKVARMFGDENTVASVCGHDHVSQSSSFPEGVSRAHVFMNQHFYPNKKGSGTGPFYAPKGYSGNLVPGGMAKSNGSYNLSYPRGFGDLKGSYLLNMNHLATPRTGVKLGSGTSRVQVGTLAGTGGKSEKNTYDHSHIQLLKGKDSKGRALRHNFVDAFCRSDNQ